MEKNKILIVDDDNNISRLISLYLTKEFFTCEIANNGEDALEHFKSFQPDLVLLDIMLPGMDGYAVCREIRKTSKTPIIMLSAKGEVFDKVLGLELGADDYIMKPFDSKEMVARVKAVLRRFSPASDESTSKEQKSQEISYPDLKISLLNYTTTFQDELIEMPPKELELLFFLANHPNQVFTRDQLLDQIWGYDYIGESRTVDVHVKRLREKLRESEFWKLTTVWGVGYKFETIEKD